MQQKSLCLIRIQDSNPTPEWTKLELVRKAYVEYPVPVWVCHYLSHPVTFGAVPTPGTDRLTPAMGKSLGVGIFKSEDLIMHHGRSPYMY